MNSTLNAPVQIKVLSITDEKNRVGANETHVTYRNDYSAGEKGDET